MKTLSNNSLMIIIMLALERTENQLLCSKAFANRNAIDANKGMSRPVTITDFDHKIKN